MKPSSKFGIRLPNLPRPLEPGLLTGLEDHETYSRLVFSERDFSASQSQADPYRSLAFDQVLFQNVSFLQQQVGSLRMSDCRLERCDLSAAVWMGTRLRRVEFSGCRLLGAALAEGTLEDAFFQDCLAERANFSWAVFKGARFEKCNLRDAVFLGADLSGVVFRGCDLTGADLRDARLAGADLRGTVLDGLKVSSKDLQGTILTTVQAMQVMGLLGIQIRELGEEGQQEVVG
jgi:uncharacterized protein YjbI with pentapeptide repeats